ncbi:MAG: DUF1348 family protein [Planctomycetota bacterium]
MFIDASSTNQSPTTRTLSIDARRLRFAVKGKTLSQAGQPPFTLETAAAKVRAAENAWNSFPQHIHTAGISNDTAQ